MAPPRPPSPTLRGMEKGIPPKPRTKPKPSSSTGTSSKTKTKAKAKNKTKPRERRKSHYSKTAHMYVNKPLPALPKPSSSHSSSRASSREGGSSGAAGEGAGADDPARPLPLNIPRRPKMTSVQGLDTSAVVPPTPPPRDDARIPPPAPPPVPSSSLAGGATRAAAQTNETDTRPEVPPRHPGRPSPHTLTHHRRSFSGGHHNNDNNSSSSSSGHMNRPTGVTGHRSNCKVRQLTGYDVDIYDDIRDRLSSLGLHQRGPVDSLLESYRSGALGLSLPKEEEAAVVDFRDDTAGASPTTPFPVHGYEPCVGSPEFGSEGTASAAGSRHGSAHFSFSSRPSWSSSHNNSPHLSFDGGGGAAISPIRSRDSFSDNEAAIDYHRFATELAGRSSTRPSGELRRYSSQSSAGAGAHGRGHTREKSSSSLQSLRRASSQSASIAEFRQQWSSFQRNRTPAPAPAPAPASTHRPAVIETPQKQSSVRKKKTASASFSSKPWSVEEKRKWYKENNKLVLADDVRAPATVPGPVPASAAAPATAKSPAKSPAKASAKAPVATIRPPTRASAPGPATGPAAAAAAAAASPSAPTAEPEPRSVFESDSSDEDGEVGIKDSIKGFLRRRMSNNQDNTSPVGGNRAQRGSASVIAGGSGTGSKDDSDRRLLDKARERRAEKRSREFRRHPGRDHMSNEELSKWFRDSPTRHILS